MNRTHIFAALAAALGLVAAGCGNKAEGYKPVPLQKVELVSIQPGQEMSLFPLAEGNQWVYTVEAAVQGPRGSGGDRGEVTLRVKTVRNVGDGKQASIDIVRNEEVQERTEWLVNSKGIYQLSSGRAGIKFDPPQLQFAFPYEKGKVFKWLGNGALPNGGQGKVDIVSRTIGPEECDTDMGRFSTIAVQSNYRWRDAKGMDFRMVGNSWWRPGVGLIRIRQEMVSPDGTTAVQLLRLKSSTLK